MRKSCFLLLAALLMSVSAASAKTLEVFYIAHDHYESALNEAFKIIHRNARYDTNRTVVFYLANGAYPCYFVVNPKDDQEYETFSETLIAQSSHRVHPDVDRRTLISILSEGLVLPTKGFDAYDSVAFNFYINQYFVRDGYCDSVIARLFWDMDLIALPKGKLEITLYHPDDNFDYDEPGLFGRQNLMGGFEVLTMEFD